MINRRPNYVKTRTPEGKLSYRSNDPVSEALDGLTLEQKAEIASGVLDVTPEEVLAAVSHLNKGMQIMAITGKVRGAVRRDEKLEESAGVLEAIKIQAQAYRDAMAEARAAAAVEGADEVAA
jgi:hypothetical protein